MSRFNTPRGGAPPNVYQPPQQPLTSPKKQHHLDDGLAHTPVAAAAAAVATAGPVSAGGSGQPVLDPVVGASPLPSPGSARGGGGGAGLLPRRSSVATSSAAAATGSASGGGAHSRTGSAARLQPLRTPRGSVASTTATGAAAAAAAATAAAAAANAAGTAALLPAASPLHPLSSAAANAQHNARARTNSAHAMRSAGAGQQRTGQSAQLHTQHARNGSGSDDIDPAEVMAAIGHRRGHHHSRAALRTAGATPTSTTSTSASASASPSSAFAAAAVAMGYDSASSAASSRTSSAAASRAGHRAQARAAAHEHHSSSSRSPPARPLTPSRDRERQERAEREQLRAAQENFETRLMARAGYVTCCLELRAAVMEADRAAKPDTKLELYATHLVQATNGADLHADVNAQSGVGLRRAFVSAVVRVLEHYARALGWRATLVGAWTDASAATAATPSSSSSSSSSASAGSGSGSGFPVASGWPTSVTVTLSKAAARSDALVVREFFAALYDRKLSDAQTLWPAYVRAGYGANHVSAERGRTPLHVAVESGDAQAVAWLLGDDCAADPNARSPYFVFPNERDESHAVLLAVARAPDTAIKPLFAQLLSAGAHVSTSCIAHYTPRLVVQWALYVGTKKYSKTCNALRALLCDLFLPPRISSGNGGGGGVGNGNGSGSPTPSPPPSPSPPSSPSAVSTASTTAAGSRPYGAGSRSGSDPCSTPAAGPASTRASSLPPSPVVLHRIADLPLDAVRLVTAYVCRADARASSERDSLLTAVHGGWCAHLFYGDIFLKKFAPAPSGAPGARRFSFVRQKPTGAAATAATPGAANANGTTAADGTASAAATPSSTTHAAVATAASRRHAAVPSADHSAAAASKTDDPNGLSTALFVSPAIHARSTLAAAGATATAAAPAATAAAASAAAAAATKMSKRGTLVKVPFSVLVGHQSHANGASAPSTAGGGGGGGSLSAAATPMASAGQPPPLTRAPSSGSSHSQSAASTPHAHPPGHHHRAQVRGNKPQPQQQQQPPPPQPQPQPQQQQQQHARPRTGSVSGAAARSHGRGRDSGSGSGTGSGAGSAHASGEGQRFEVVGAGALNARDGNITPATGLSPAMSPMPSSSLSSAGGNNGVFAAAFVGYTHSTDASPRGHPLSARNARKRGSNPARHAHGGAGSGSGSGRGSGNGIPTALGGTVIGSANGRRPSVVPLGGGGAGNAAAMPANGGGSGGTTPRASASSTTAAPVMAAGVGATADILYYLP